MIGRFITFEGGEGAGKSTQVKLLSERLGGTHNVVVTREPGGTGEAEAIRALLVTGHVGRWSAEAEALLNYAARDSHLGRVIRPALERGAVVLCDRFMDSTRAYQGYAGGVRMQLIDELEHSIVGPTRPDMTLIFDLDVDLGLARAGGRANSHEDRFERKGRDFHEKLRQGFLDIARREPERCRVIDASQSVETVSDAVWRHVRDLL